MKKVLLCVGLLCIGIGIGRLSVPRTEKEVIADIEWAATKACDAKIIQIKKQCK